MVWFVGLFVCLFVFFISGNLCFSFVLGMVMYVNEVDTREKWKLPAIKTINYNIYMNDGRLFKHCSLYCGYIMLLSIKNISTCLTGSSSTANSPWPTGANQIWKMQVIYHRRYIWSETRLRGQQTIDQHRFTPGAAA